MLNINRYQGVAIIALVAALLVACGSESEPPQPDAQQPVVEAGAPTVPPATPTPEPFKERLVFCALDAPSNLLIDRGPAAEAVRSMTMLQPVLFGDDYLAETSPQYTYLAALPSEEAGTLLRDDLGQIVVTLQYRTDLVWSDGEIFDAADAELGLRLPAPPDKPVFNVVDVSQIDQFTLEVTAAPGAEYPYVPFALPLPEHVLGAEVTLEDVQNSAFAQTLTPALGLYLATPLESGILLQQNAAFTGAVGMPVVELQTVADATALANAVGSADCDVTLDGYLTFDQFIPLEGNPALNAISNQSPLREQLYLNTFAPSASGRAPFFADVRTRQAVAQALNIEAIAATQTNFSALESWIVPGHWAYAGEGIVPVYAHSPDAARSLLSEAGWSDINGDSILEYGGDGGDYACQRGRWLIEEEQPFDVSLIYPSGDADRQVIADTIVSELAAVGIRVSARAIDPAEMFSPSGPLAQRQFDMALLAGVNRPDPDGIALWAGSEVFINPADGSLAHRWELEDRYIETLQLSEIVALNNVPSFANDFTGQNFAGYCNEEANIAIADANRQLSIEARQPLYVQHQQLLAQDVPVVPLYARPEYVISKAYVCGVAPGPYDPVVWNIGSWFFDETGTCTAG